jgi:hypothetical protein
MLPSCHARTAAPHPESRAPGLAPPRLQDPLHPFRSGAQAASPKVVFLASVRILREKMDQIRSEDADKAGDAKRALELARFLRLATFWAIIAFGSVLALTAATIQLALAS